MTTVTAQALQKMRQQVMERKIFTFLCTMLPEDEVTHEKTFICLFHHCAMSLVVKMQRMVVVVVAGGVYSVFKPPPPVGAGRGYMFSGRPSVPLSMRPSVRDSRGSFMFPRYLQYLLTDFRQTFVTGASWDTDDLIAFLGQEVKVEGHTIATEAHSTRRYRRVQLFLVSNAFLCCIWRITHTVCPTRHIRTLYLCLFSEDAWRLFSSGVPFHDLLPQLL